MDGGKAGMTTNRKLLNYSTRVSASVTLGQITDTLVKHGAESINTLYDPETHQPRALAWRAQTRQGNLSYALPCRVEAVFEILTRQRVLVRNADARREQAARVAWRILKDWVEAQMALLETGMVDLEEIFLPNMLTGTGEQQRTVYEALLAGSGLPALQAPTGDLVEGK